MHFGPEWMRAKQHPAARAQNSPSPPSTYSALVAPTQFEKSDDHNPFGYSKEEILRIYKENTNKGGLGLEVERWEGVVRDVINEPMSLREMGEAEKKLFAGSLNSDLRRRQSVDYLSPLSTSTDRSRLNYSNSITGSPLRERFGPLRRRDSTDSPSSAAPLTRKQSVPSLQNTGIAPRDVGLPSPRNRVGLTHNLDGVSSSGDPWTARRRTSEVSLKSAIGISREASSDLHEVKVNDIPEDREDVGFNGEVEKYSDRAPDDLSAYQVNYSAAQSLGSNDTELHDVKVHANHSFENTVHYSKLDRAPNGPPPGLSDLASVEWSYKDPTGQIQGPFRADLMQKWYDEGYFSFDLPTKRTHLDTHWATVEDLLRRAGDDKIFLSVPQPTAPPGLVRTIDSPSYSGLTEQNVYKTLSQPSPIRTLHSSALDSYVTPVSNPSNSPSSFGGARFSNGSSDSLAINGRTASLSYLGEPSVNGRVTNLANLTDVSAPLLARRATLNDTALDSGMVHSQPYSNATSSRTASLGEYAFSGHYNSGSYTPILDSVAPPRNVDPMPLNAYNQNPGLEPPLNYHNGRSGHEGVFQDNVLGDPAFNQSDYGIVDGVQRIGLVNEEASPFNHYGTFVGAGPGQVQFGQPFPPHANVHGSARTTLDSLDQHPATVIDGPSDAQAESEAAVQSPWQDITDVSAARGTSVDILQSSPVSPWGDKIEGSQQLPWSYQASAPDSWKRDRLTFSNVVQHNQQYPMNNGEVATLSAPDSSNLQEEQAEAIHTLPTENACVVSGNAAQPSHNQIIPQPEERKPEVTLVTPDVPDKTDASAQLPAPKIVWSKEPSPSISLREIQEAEAKKVEVRKAAERAIRTASAESKEEAQAFTTSWGLPSSQAGARLPGPSKEAAPASPSTPAPPTPVWTNAVKSSAAKKSMKEIQEEEERRKRLLSTKEPTVPTSARKAPVHEPVNKGATSQGSAWTVIGPNGKPTAPVVVSAKLPPTSASSAVVPSSSSRVNGSAIARSVAPIAPTKVPSSITPKLDDSPSAPSHEFLRWLTDSLKGLNNSVNVEEIMSMLLSFPLDPDSSTIELISDLIYTNSTTLDGRRFAAEFVSKRKNDAKAKGAGSSSKSLAKPVSIADVVKAAPKAAQSEWAFKVVNKKKKGGRT
ncbi:hypothetical protein APHAL10511_006167 [Amanita phalloides]|nr:hypothetical protein APHAL10511_006167 [Amanita phalloides]